MFSASWLRPGSFVLLVLCLTLAGCASNARAKVKGKVKFFDKTLTAGTVSFTAKDGRQGTGNIDFEGNYEVGDAPVGDVTITVITPVAPKLPPGAMGPPKPPPGVPDMKGHGGSTPAPAIDPSKIVEIPGKYGKVETSGLTYTVVKGDQEKNIVLTP